MGHPPSFLCYPMCAFASLPHTVTPFSPNSYIRAIGMLYLRYTAEPDTLWTWFSDYVDDPAPIKVKMGTSDSAVVWLHSDDRLKQGRCSLTSRARL